MPTIITTGAASARGFGFNKAQKSLSQPINSSNYVGLLTGVYGYRGATFDRISGYWLYNQAQSSSEPVYRMSISTTGSTTQFGPFTVNTPGPGQRGYVVHPVNNWLYSCSYGNFNVFYGAYSGTTSTVNMGITGNASLQDSPWGMTYNSDQDRLVVAQAFNSVTASYWDNFSTQSGLGSANGTIVFYNHTGGTINTCGIAYDSDAKCYYVSSYDGGNNIYVCNQDGSSKSAPFSVGGPAFGNGIGMLAYYNGILICQPDENLRDPSNPLRMFYRAV